MAIVTPYSHLAALVVDDQAAQQTTLRGHLNLLGIGRVDGASNPDAALRHIRRTEYQLILCDYNLDTRTDGQQMLEHLRETQELAPDALFFMITAEAGYASVAAASEQHPDAYLLKPATAADIAERLKTALERRAAVLPVMVALKERDHERAVLECDQAIRRGGRWVLYALQLKAGALLKMGRFDDARWVYEEVLQLRPGLVWARLGIARAELALGRHDDALLRARAIVDSREGCRTLAAYDVLASSLEARGDGRGAIDALRQAADFVPSPRRHRALGEAAFRAGDLRTAQACLARVTAATRGAVTAQPADALMLAQVHVDLGQPKEALSVLADRMFTQLQDQHDNASAVAAAIQAQALAAQGQADAARAAADRAAATLLDSSPDFGTVALARAEFATGQEEAALARLARAMTGDHENHRFRQLTEAALERAGHADKIDAVIEQAMKAMKASIDDARRLLRSGDPSAALAGIEATLAQAPNNTGVLLEATQIACMSLRLNRRLDEAVVARARTYLSRLEQLMPDNDRVARMRRYLLDTLDALAADRAAGASAPSTAAATA